MSEMAKLGKKMAHFKFKHIYIYWNPTQMLIRTGVSQCAPLHISESVYVARASEWTDMREDMACGKSNTAADKHDI